MKLFLILYPGSYMSGRAIIAAENAANAIDMLCEEDEYFVHNWKEQPKDCEVIDITDQSEESVIYNWNGEY